MNRIIQSLIIFFIFILTGELFALNENSLSISFQQIFTEQKSVKGNVPNSLEYQSFQLNINDPDKFFKSNKEIQINDFPVNQTEKKTITLKACRPIIDANTKFLVGNSKDNNGRKIPSVNSFKGIVEGEPGSKVFLCYVDGSIFCRMEEPNKLPVMLCPSINKVGSEHILISEKQFYTKGKFDFKCYTDELQKNFNDTHKNFDFKPLADNLLEVEVAVETDSCFYVATGGTVEKAQAYTLALFSMVSTIYEEELNIIIYVPWIKTWTDKDPDPYHVNGNAYILPDKVMPYWKEYYKEVKRDVFHVMTSIYYGGGGIGYYDALCSKNGDWGFSVSSVQAGHQYPTYAFTYDVYIVAHELGHNFNGQHTHSCFFKPPLDTCVVDEGIAGGCLDSTEKAKPNSGSIMSYCGGTNNQNGLGWQVRMTFLPQNQQIMRQTAEESECLTEPVKPVIFILTPKNQVIYKPGDIIPITWSSARVNNVNLELSADLGKNWETFASALSAADRQYNWTVPDICSKSVLIRISDMNNPMITNDTTLLPITILKEDPYGLIAYYPFNSNSNDEQYCGFNNALPINNPELCPDRFDNKNNAYIFNGSNYLYVPKFDYTFSDFTVSFWFNSNDLSGVRQIIGSNWQEAWTFSVYYWGQYGVSLYWDGNGSPYQLWGGWLETNKWYHGALTHDGNSAKLYLNGNVVAESPQESHKINNFTEQPLYIGSRKDADYFSGKIDDIKIYKRALSQEEIKKLYDETVPVHEPNVELNPDNMLEINPNPSSEQVTINYQINNPGITFIDLLTLTGEQINTIINEYREPGIYSLPLNTKNLTTGIYLIKMITNKECTIQKLIIVK